MSSDGPSHCNSVEIPPPNWELRLPYVVEYIIFLAALAVVGQYKIEIILYTLIPSSFS